MQVPYRDISGAESGAGPWLAQQRGLEVHSALINCCLLPICLTPTQNSTLSLTTMASFVREVLSATGTLGDKQDFPEKIVKIKKKLHDLKSQLESHIDSRYCDFSTRCEFRLFVLFNRYFLLSGWIVQRGSARTSPSWRRRWP